jgi:phosphate transport system protein
MEDSRDESQDARRPSGPTSSFHGRHAIREQDILWTEFLAMARTIVDSLAKSIDALCEGRLELIAEVKSVEEESDREEVRIEQECLRILALYEPVASDLRRLATILKVNRDWERIADLAARIARRARKLAKKSGGVPIPDPLKALARAVLAEVRASYDALVGRDARRARAVIAEDRSINRQYRRFRRELKQDLRLHAGRLNAWLQLMSTARNLERIADHATDIAQTIVYLEEGIIIRHGKETPPSSP